MTELDTLRWILGIVVVAGSLALLVLYFYRNTPSPEQSVGSPADSRKALQEVLLAQSSGNNVPIPSTILESEAYEALQQCIRSGVVMNESNPIWVRLEETVTGSCPDFKSRLYVLGGGSLKPIDFHMALLIRCAVSPANIAMLVGRSKPTVTFRRKDLGKKLFDREMDANRVDELIRLI